MILQRESHIKFYDMHIEPIPALVTNLNCVALKKKKRKRLELNLNYLNRTFPKNRSMRTKNKSS